MAVKMRIVILEPFNLDMRQEIFEGTSYNVDNHKRYALLW